MVVDDITDDITDDINGDWLKPVPQKCHGSYTVLLMNELIESDNSIICNYEFGFAGSMFGCDSLSVLFSHCVVHVDACGRNKPLHQVG